MAKVKVVNKNQNQDLIGGNFTNTASGTVINGGSFSVTSNFAGRTEINYSDELTSFPKPITLEDINVDVEQSKTIKEFSENIVLNYDNSDLKSYVKFGSTREYLRVSIETIVSEFVGSIYVDNNYNQNTVVFDYSFNTTTNISTFKIPSEYMINNFGIAFDYGNNNIIDGDELKNMNVSYNEYVIWQQDDPLNNDHGILSFTGDTKNRPYVILEVSGDPFPELNDSNTSSNEYKYHLKPKPIHFNTFISTLEPFQEYVLTNRSDDYTGFDITIKQPQLLDSGQIIYLDTKLRWFTSDGYNIDYQYGRYESFLEQFLGIGNKYDTIKTDLIARFLVPASFIDFDYSDESKNTKLLRIYGREFDNVKQFIDSLVNINKVSYNKINNIPDQLVKNLAEAFGWETFTLINENDLIGTFFNTDSESNSSDLTPAELDIELWRRILINTHYFWKTKGNREAIKTMLVLIGIPESFIKINEYVYTVDGKINPDEVEISLEDLPSASLPYDDDGYPIAPIETDSFFFQVSGNTDNGQQYMNNFRSVGFNLNKVVDNKKSWVEEGEIERIHSSTPNYYQEDSKLVINTKEFDISVDIANGIEYDIFNYVKNVDDIINSTGYTSTYSYVNLSLDYNSPAYKFQLPQTPNGDVQVMFNGIMLVSGATANEGDYHLVTNSPTHIVLHTEKAYKRYDEDSDVVVITYLYDELGVTMQGTIEYVVCRVTSSVNGTKIPLPSTPKGDVQLTVNGISLTQGTSLFVGDYIKNPNNENELIVQNSELSSYLLTNPVLQVAMISGNDEVTLEKKIEFHRVDSFNSNKFYIDSSSNTSRYVMNYKVNNVKNVKVTINGITLAPIVDYKININNPYEIILPASIKLADIIGVYYLVDSSNSNKPIIDDVYGIGDISKMSFLEFNEIIQRRMINARDRKIISDYKGGYYPALLNVYVDYIKRSYLDDSSELKSNGYLFMDLYPYFNKYNTFFEKFVEILLPATIIRKTTGFIVRNTIYTRQKYMYRRGVNFNSNINWLGNDGSEFMIHQEAGHEYGYGYYGYGTWDFHPIGLENLQYSENNTIFDETINVDTLFN